MDAFDADALIYAAVPDHDLGRRVAALVGEAPMAPGDPPAGLGSDAVHLATAVISGADRFITNNRRDFPDSIDEIHITYPIDLPDPTDGSA